MGDIINFRRARKARERAREKAEAAARAATHGESQAARRRREAEALIETRRLDGAKRDPDAPPDDDAG